MIVAFLIYLVFVVFFNFTLEISFFCSELFVRAWSSLNRATRVFNCSYYVNGKQNYRLLKINNFFFLPTKTFSSPRKAHTRDEMEVSSKMRSFFYNFKCVLEKKQDGKDDKRKSTCCNSTIKSSKH